MTKNTSCPICRGEIHAIAGRCKHCKSDLVDLRERASRIARAQAMGATVPPAPYPLAPPGPGPRPATIPPPPHGPFPPREGPITLQFAAVEPDHTSTLVDHPAEPAPFAPDPPPSRLPTHGGAPSFGLGFAGARPPRGSTWSRRWPFVVSAVALLAIGISIGVLAERWRRDADGRVQGPVRQSRVTRSPVMVPDHMPQPLIPGPHSPRPVEPAVPDPQQAPNSPPPADRDDDADDDDENDGDRADGTHSQAVPSPPSPPDPSNPGSRFSQPPSTEPGSDASAFRTFTASLTESLCQKLTQCGLIDSATQSMCRVFAQELDPEDAAERVARGECSFNQRAADACLRAVGDLRCDMGSSDRMWDWLMAPNRVGECAEAYVCQ
jgi:hypothetical protein